MAVMAMSSVSATKFDNNNLTIEEIPEEVNISAHNDIATLELSNESDETLEGINIEIPDAPDAPDLIVNETIYIHPSDIDEYFIDGILQPKYANKTLVLMGNFENVGKLIVDVDNVTITGASSYLKNTLFDISGNGVTLSNLNIDLDSEYEDNDYAGILVSSDDVVLSNLNINYIVPHNTEAYAIYAVGNPRNPAKNLKIINSNIYFEGHNDDINVYDNAVKIMYYKDSLMDNNTIITSLPLKNVDHGAFGATLDSDFVLTVGLENCDRFIFSNNSLVSDVNKRPGSTYPTLDCMMISLSDNCLILNNSIYMTDFVTYPGVENYLYGLDIYHLNNLTVAYNTINIVTTGGKMSLGTAYPIQITGPIADVVITENDLYSFSNGPNIGIYSQNYYGGTALSITKNRINVTGLAGTHEWALVAGIESQDSNSYIVDNIIEVHSVGEVGEGDNLYGISYRQSIAGNHSFNIENNTVFSDGFTSVYLLESVNSNVSNNLLVSYNENAKNGNTGFKYGDVASQKGISFYNNKVLKAFDYFAGLNNNIDGGNGEDYSNPTNGNGITNDVDGNGFSPKDSTISRPYNPLIPGDGSQNWNYEHVGDQTEKPNHDNGEDVDNPNHDAYPTISFNKESSKDDNKDNANENYDSRSNVLLNNVNSDKDSKDNTDKNSESDSPQTYTIKDIISSYFNSDVKDSEVRESDSELSENNYNSNVASNSSDSTPSDAGDSALLLDSSSSSVPSAGEEGGSQGVTKYYELEEKLEKEEFIPSIFYVLLAVILLIVGIKRKKQLLDD